MTLLVISRKIDESFFIGDDIEVVVLDIANNKIKIGINAPGDVKIIRKELIETQKANLDSANSSEIIQIENI